MVRLNLPLKWHGGKAYLARRIVSLMPAHLHYVEPYAGGLAVLLAKDPHGISEVVNDINGDLTNFWTVLRDEECFARFRRRVEATPFSQAEWKVATAIPRVLDPDVDAAVAFFVKTRQSLAGRGDSFAPLSRNRTRRGMNEQASAWLTCVEGLAAVHARLKRIVVLNDDAVNVIRGQDGPQTLFYCDPPYLAETRKAKQVYDQEMTLEQHEDLLTVVQGLAGKVMVSGYENALYDSRLATWRRHVFDLPNNAASGPAKRRMHEIVWCNY